MKSDSLGDALSRARGARKVVALLMSLVLLVVSSGIAHASIVEHLVRSGESLWVLSVWHRTSVPAIQRLNTLPGTTIYPGQTLQIPADSRVHVVSRGETLGEIALWYRAEVQVIRTANAVSDIIYPGQKLLIPDAQSGQAAVTA
ncbi:MAG: LysM peptidoglycan-binding domain-containing protein, partial [Bacillota bacterium]